MKIALVNPPAKQHITRRWRCAVEQGHYLFPPIELCYIGGILNRKKSAQLILIDCIAEKIGIDKLMYELKQFMPDMVIFMPGFENIENDLGIMEDVKKNTNSKLVCFGFYPTIFANKIMKKFDIDFIIHGEPEITISELYDAVEKKQNLSDIDGLVYRKGEKIKKNKERKNIQNLDDLPFPDRSLIKNNLYYSAFLDKKPFTTILTTRGCPYRCTYCIRTYGDVLRQRSVDNIIAEIDEMVKEHGIKSMYIIDDTFTFNKKRVLEFCKKLEKRKYKIRWSCLSRPETLDKEMLKAMKKIGCLRILIGIESGSERILKYYGRDYNLKKIKILFSDMKSVGIQSFGFFMLGAPIETKKDIEKSLEIAKFTNPDFLTLNIVRIYPGTELFSNMQKEGNVKFNLFPHNVIFDTIIPKEEINKIMFKFYRLYYFRLGYFLSHIPLLIKNPLNTLRLLFEYVKWERRGKNF